MSTGPENSVNLDDYEDSSVKLVITGDDKVYVGDRFYYAPGVAGGGYNVPEYKDRYEVAQEGFAAIIKDQSATDQLKKAYNLYNGKKLDARVGADDLERFYSDAVYEASKRSPESKVTALDVIYGRMPSQEALEAMGGFGGAGAGGPRTRQTITKMAESDIRLLANEIAMEMTGRGVTDRELTKIVDRMRKAEMQQPSVTTTGKTQTISQEGLTTTGRQDIIKNIISAKPEYAEFQKATTLMDWFDEALQERMQ